MLLSARTARRAVAGTIGAGAVAGAMFGAPLALADPPPPPPSPGPAAPGPAAPAPASPPNCTAADLAGVSSGVAASTSAYLFSHPDVNAFFTGLKGQPRDAIRDDVQNYLNSNPQVKTDLQGIRQPLVDLKNRCNA